MWPCLNCRRGFSFQTKNPHLPHQKSVFHLFSLLSPHSLGGGNMDFQQEMLGRTRKKTIFHLPDSNSFAEKKGEEKYLLGNGCWWRSGKKKSQFWERQQKRTVFQRFFFLGNPGCGFVSCELGLVPSERKTHDNRLLPRFFRIWERGVFGFTLWLFFEQWRIGGARKAPRFYGKKYYFFRTIEFP